MSGASGYLVTPSQRRTLLTGPLGAVLLLGGEATAGSLALVEHPLEPRALGSPLHTHRDEDEFSVVLEGGGARRSASRPSRPSRARCW